MYIVLIALLDLKINNALYAAQELFVVPLEMTEDNLLSGARCMGVASLKPLGGWVILPTTSVYRIDFTPIYIKAVLQKLLSGGEMSDLSHAHHLELTKLPSQI